MTGTRARGLPPGPLPEFFIHACREARSDPGGFERAGRSLLANLASPPLVPYPIDRSEWLRRVGVIAGLVGRRDDEGVLAWFDAHLSRCMAMVPRPERGRFLLGVYEAAGGRPGSAPSAR